jgi:acetoin utilization deacetylase AcuC-like enzyme
MTELLLVEQPLGEADAAPWILDRHGRKTQGHDDSRRTLELQRGLERHRGVRSTRAETPVEEVERIVSALHEPHYIQALREMTTDEPTLLPQWAPPGLPADSPVWRGVVTTAFGGVRTAISAAEHLAGGARFAYAVCRPPGHHAGPAWMGGYCYLNTAATAARALCDAGVGPVAILDVDFHFPTGTRAMVERMEGVDLHSLHASTLEEVPWKEVVPRAHERFVGFAGDPGTAAYLDALEASVSEIAASSAALVLSLGYDIVGGDPHGSWSFPSGVFADIGRVLAKAGLPVCVVQEGGYAVDLLAECAHAFVSGLLDEPQQRLGTSRHERVTVDHVTSGGAR